MALTETQGPINALMHSLKRLFNDGSYSDLTIVCGDDRHKVHKAIICPRSQFFASACDGNFQEAETGIIHLPEDDPLAVKMMLYYFYHLDYSEAIPSTAEHGETATVSQIFTFQCTHEPSEVPSEKPRAASADGTNGNAGNTPLNRKRKKMKNKRPAQPHPRKVPATPNLTLHAKVYALGEKYGVEDLEELAVNKFRAEAEDHWQSDDFLNAIRETYTSTVDQDRLLRDIVVDVINEHLELLDQPSVQETIKDLSICFDLLMRSRPQSTPQPAFTVLCAF